MLNIINLKKTKWEKKQDKKAERQIGKLVSLSNYLLLEDMINKRPKITAYSMYKYRSTRLTNNILILRKFIDIETIYHTTENGKRYGSYHLKQTKKNIKSSKEIRDFIKLELVAKSKIR